MSVCFLFFFSFFLNPICILQHSPFTVVKQGTRIVVWSQRPCVKQKRACGRTSQVTGNDGVSRELLISWNRASFTQKHYTKWEYAGAVLSFFLKTEFKHVDEMQTQQKHVQNEGERRVWRGAPHGQFALDATQATAKHHKSTHFFIFDISLLAGMKKKERESI